MASTQEKVVQCLHEALAMELALVRTLQAHRAMTPSGPYRDALERHLGETRGHADRLRRRLAELNRGPSLAMRSYGIAQQAVGQALALGKAPLDVVRGGTNAEEKLLKNAKDECATEALEIATYDALEELAQQAGDERTAELAAAHRADEERMLATLREELPALAAAVVGGEPMTGRRSAGSPARGDGGERAASRAPLAGYDELNVEDVAARLEDLSPTQLRELARYERAHKDRRGVLDAIERRERAATV